MNFFKLVFCLIFSENELLNQAIKNNSFNFNHYVIDFNLFIDQETVFKDSNKVRYETTIHYMYTIFSNITYNNFTTDIIRFSGRCKHL